MVAKVFGAITLGIVGIIIADFLIHPGPTSQLTQSAITAEKVGTNALLGKTS